MFDYYSYLVFFRLAEMDRLLIFCVLKLLINYSALSRSMKVPKSKFWSSGHFVSRCGACLSKIVSLLFLNGCERGRTVNTDLLFLSIMTSSRPLTPTEAPVWSLDPKRLKRLHLLHQWGNQTSSQHNVFPSCLFFLASAAAMKSFGSSPRSIRGGGSHWE